MLYSILIYGSEAQVAAWAPDQEDEVLGRHAELRQQLRAEGRMGPVVRLAPDAAGTVLRVSGGEPLVTDGPYAETKEQLMGLYFLECASLDDAVVAARRLSFDTGVFEIRPVVWFDPGMLPPHTP